MHDRICGPIVHLIPIHTSHPVWPLRPSVGEGHGIIEQEKDGDGGLAHHLYAHDVLAQTEQRCSNSYIWPGSPSQIAASANGIKTIRDGL